MSRYQIGDIIRGKTIDSLCIVINNNIIQLNEISCKVYWFDDSVITTHPESAFWDNQYRVI